VPEEEEEEDDDDGDDNEPGYCILTKNRSAS